jgi:hypothetical protein
LFFGVKASRHTRGGCMRRAENRERERREWAALEVGRPLNVHNFILFLPIIFNFIYQSFDNIYC